jgi:Cd2+/Zn2+-exporting ATPase
MNPEVNTHRSFFVSGVCCATEDGIVRKHLAALVGEEGYTFNSLTHELCLSDASKSEAVTQRLNRAGFPARSKEELQQPQSFWELHRDGGATGVATILAVTGMMAEQFGVAEVIVHGLLLSAIVIGGWRVFIRAWKSARTYAFDMNVLLSVAVVGALMIGKWSEGATVIILFAISLMLESYGNARTRRAVQSLMALSPERACVVVNGQEAIIPAKEVVPGQIVLVRPGEHIPIDGLIVDGRSLLDQSVVTGEATPVVRAIGEQVFAGSINGRGFLRVQSTARHEDTTLARIVHLVEAAQLKRAPVQNLVEKFARIYTPFVLVVAVAVAVLPPLIMQASFEEWFYRALVLLVIACPCALVISTPVALVSALTHAARLGILIKGGRQIETLSKVQAIAFDKTGTLTRGRPTVTDIVPLNSLPRERILQIVAALEHRSEHPLASAIVNEAVRHSIEFDQLAVRKFEALPGLGVKAEIDSEQYYLGNHQLCKEQAFSSIEVEQVLERLDREGKTAIILGKRNEALCVLAVRDSIRDQSKPAVNALKALGVRHIILLSGDHETSAQRIADEVGIEEYRGALLPHQKIELVEQLKAQYDTVAMVGDGINDAPAMAASSVGISMGASGAGAALETADVVLMGDDLSRLPLLIRLSRDAMSIIRQNIVIALSLKLLFLLLSVAGMATLWMAVLADDGAALIVIFNSLRMLSISEET